MTAPTSRPAQGAVHQKTVIVTGASQGIGAGVVAALRRSGYGVVATALSMPPSADADLLAVEGDIADPTTADRVFDQALDRFGRVDTVVNNAGIFIGKHFTDYTAADLDRMLAVNLAGFFHVTQHAVTQMLTQRSGHIVNVTASIVDHARASAPSALAALTKGGLDAVTRSLAIEYAAAGIRVNAVAPGVIRTQLHDPAAYDGLRDYHPLGRIGEVEDVV
ncbi:MAG: SDR family oxidoreductase, partial [Nocardioides sp.]